MSPAATRRPRGHIAEVDDSAADPAVVGGSDIREFIDETSLRSETEKAATRNRAEVRPYRQYQKRVIEAAGVPNTQQTRQMTSHICGAVARLPFVPDDEVVLEIQNPGTENERGITEFDQQVAKTAQFAEAQLGSEMVWTVSARKLARAALDLRRQDPDGSKGIAWVNETREDEAGVLDE